MKHASLTNAVAERCRTCPARKVGPCASLDISTLRKVAARSTQSRYEPGAEIIAQGEPSTRIGLVVSGMVKIVMLNEDGDESLLQVLKTGELVGDPFQPENPFSSIALTEVELCWMQSDAFTALLSDCPSVGQGYLGTAMKQLQKQRQSVASMRGRNTLQRVAHWLGSQVPADAMDLRPRIRVLMSRRDLASMLDMTVETLCRVLHQLAERNAISLLSSDLIEISDMARLRLLAKDHATPADADLGVAGAGTRLEPSPTAQAARFAAE